MSRTPWLHAQLFQPFSDIVREWPFVEAFFGADGRHDCCAVADAVPCGRQRLVWVQICCMQKGRSISLRMPPSRTEWLTVGSIERERDPDISVKWQPVVGAEVVRPPIRLKTRGGEIVRGQHNLDLAQKAPRWNASDGPDEQVLEICAQEKFGVEGQRQIVDRLRCSEAKAELFKGTVIGIHVLDEELEFRGHAPVAPGLMRRCKSISCKVYL